MKFRLLPLFFLCLLTASTGYAATRHIEISWAPVQAQGIDLIGFQLYLHDTSLQTNTKLDQCRIEDPSATRMSCDIELPDEQTLAYFTMTSYCAAYESPHSTPFPVTFSQPETLQAVIDATVTAGSLNVHFDGTNSTGSITHYTWNFGDSTTSTESVTDHTFLAAGTYTVSLTVGDGQETSTVSQEIEVTTASNVNDPPTASLSATTSVNGNAPLTVSFDASESSDPENDPLTYQWDFGDGTTGDNLTQLSHEFLIPGLYTVTLTVIDTAGNSDSSTLPILVSSSETPGDDTPVASISASRTSGIAPVTISFDGGSSKPSEEDGTIGQYTWYFGDGSTGDGQVVDHTFQENGSYTVALIVTDDSGKTAETTVSINLSDRRDTIQALQTIYHLLLLNNKKSEPAEPLEQ